MSSTHTSKRLCTGIYRNQQSMTEQVERNNTNEDEGSATQEDDTTRGRKDSQQFNVDDSDSDDSQKTLIHDSDNTEEEEQVSDSMFDADDEDSGEDTAVEYPSSGEHPDSMSPDELEDEDELHVYTGHDTTTTTANTFFLFPNTLPTSLLPSSIAPSSSTHVTRSSLPPPPPPTARQTTAQQTMAQLRRDVRSRWRHSLGIDGSAPMLPGRRGFEPAPSRLRGCLMERVVEEGGEGGEGGGVGEEN
ncbi:hypothetical protein CC86DRAFT_193345 [Ophiobolus disseminans]|uniref:Uncharacterized protein n=1 Tax=Ophiobolus disseminans TaxID=1469910 RepID=A0A6A7A6N7_9PLEO|nr:hypothetical protein CC86DRAFT_193345 [Ophiobolus disseminans]